MELLTLNKQTWEVEISPGLALIHPFSTIITRDSSVKKESAKRDVAFVYFMTNVKSDYLQTKEIEIRTAEIKKDLGLPVTWTPDALIQEAITYCNRSKSVIEQLYEGSLVAAMDLNNYLRTTEKLLRERTPKGSAVTPVSTITGALSKVPIIMRDLNAANQELIKEQKLVEGRKKGSIEMNMFEDGL